MIARVEAVYENGLFRPLEPVALSNDEHVTLTISDLSSEIDAAQFALSEAGWAAFCEVLDRPLKTIPALRKLLTEPGVFDGVDSAR